MLIEIPQRCDSKDSFLYITGEDGLLHISWLLRDKQIVFFEKEGGEQVNSALTTCSLQEYCRGMLKNKIIREGCVTKDHIIKLLDNVELV